MKKTIAAISVLAIASFTGASAARPDGNLGVDRIGAYGVYLNTSSSVADSDNDYTGAGFEINKSLVADKSMGIDVGFDFTYLSNQNNKEFYGMDDYSYTLSTTFYRPGMISPYFMVGVAYETVDFSYTPSTGLSDWSDDTFILCGGIGMECHLIPGLSVTPAISYGYDTRADSDAGVLNFSLAGTYWFTERLGMQLSGDYQTKNDIDQFALALGLSYHF
ncbi:MAG TPA: outer membrane beta-barrel protein [Opitutales bacterium]|nr:outer membrane beta-barrel protein [Opitutales bacterium]